jgi:protein FAM50
MPRIYIVVAGQDNISLSFLLPFSDILSAVTHTLHRQNIMASSQPEGRREDMLAKQRLQMREDFERQKSNLIAETEKSRPSSNRFVGQNDSMEDSLKNSTVGLVRLEDFQQKRKALEEAKAREAAMTSDLK